MTPGRYTSFETSAPGKLRVYSTAELLMLPPPTWQVEGIIPQGGFIGLYGPPAAGKSFVAIDLALCIATGLPWHGHNVVKGNVLYISAEGGPGIGKRARAWLSTKGVNAYQPRLSWVIEPMMVASESEDIGVLIKRLDEEVQEAPDFIVIDTLARCLGGNKNDPELMGAFVAGVDQLRLYYKATAMVVHHTGWNLERERGHSSFRGAADTMIACAPRKKPESDPVVVSCEKQKDADHFKSLTFRMVKIADSIVLVPEKDVDEVICSILLVNPLKHGELWSAMQSQGGTAKTTFNRHLVGLVEKGKIIRKNGCYEVA